MKHVFDDFIFTLADSGNVLHWFQYHDVSVTLDREPEVVSSAHWGDVSTSSSTLTLLEDMSKLIEIPSISPTSPNQDTSIAAIFLHPYRLPQFQSCKKASSPFTLPRWKGAL